MAENKITFSFDKRMVFAAAAIIVLAVAIWLMVLQPQSPGVAPTPVVNAPTIQTQLEASQTETDLGSDLKSARSTLDELIDSLG